MRLALSGLSADFEWHCDLSEARSRVWLSPKWPWDGTICPRYQNPRWPRRSSPTCLSPAWSRISSVNALHGRKCPTWPIKLRRVARVHGRNIPIKYCYWRVPARLASHAIAPQNPRRTAPAGTPCRRCRRTRHMQGTGGPAPARCRAPRPWGASVAIPPTACPAGRTPAQHARGQSAGWRALGDTAMEGVRVWAQEIPLPPYRYRYGKHLVDACAWALIGPSRRPSPTRRAFKPLGFEI